MSRPKTWRSQLFLLIIIQQKLATNTRMKNKIFVYSWQQKLIKLELLF